MTVSRTLLTLVAVGVVLSLLSLVIGFACAAATGIRTIVGAAQRDRRRSAVLGELAGVFEPRLLAELDEALERSALDRSAREGSVPHTKRSALRRNT